MPLPLVLETPAMVIQATLLTAVQEHPAGAVTATIAVPPLIPKSALLGEMTNVQATDAGLFFDEEPLTAVACVADEKRTRETRNNLGQLNCGQGRGTKERGWPRR